MAPSPRLISFLFLLTIFSKQIHARESQFLSKVSATTATPSTTTINNNNVQDKTLPSKEEESFNKQELDYSGYGLFGKESSQFPTNSYNNDEKQGMRGTRYMDGGKYYYHVKNENSNSRNNNNNDKTQEEQYVPWF